MGKSKTVTKEKNAAVSKKKGMGKGGLFSIRNKIATCFLVPIAFMIVIGITSYNKAEEGMEGNFRDSTIQTLNMAVEYVDMGCSFVESEGMKYYLDTGLNKYCMDICADEEKKSITTTLNSSILSAKASNPFVGHIHLVSPAGVDMLSTKVSAEDGMLAMLDRDGKSGGKSRRIGM